MQQVHPAVNGNGYRVATLLRQLDREHLTTTGLRNRRALGPLELRVR